MITAGEVSRGLFGAWLFARFNANGITFFENTVEAFWRSFWAAAVALPVYAILLSLQSRGVSVGVGPGTSFLVHSIAYVIDWMALPFAMFYLAPIFNRDQWYCRFIVAYNWSRALQMLLMLIVSLIVATGLLPSVLGSWAIAAALIFVFIYKGFIAHVAFQATWGGAAAIVFLDFCLSLMLDGWTTKLLKIQTAVPG